MAEILLLDAMGVLNQAADDVADLLVPFARQHGNPHLTADAIDQDYVAASLGRMETPDLRLTDLL